jgi:soluble lytic murein transglycosylase-like protein
MIANGIGGALLALAVLVGAAGAAQAQDQDRNQSGDTAQDAPPPPFPEVNFRRIRVPGPDHTGPRIDIQITAPAAVPAAPQALSPAAPDGTAGGEAAAWFWREVSPALPADPRRFWAAQAHLAAAPEAADLAVPRLATLHDLATRYGREILMASIGTEVSPALILAVMAVESAGRVEAVSSAGAQGLMQLIPATAARFGVADVFEPAQNIAGGAAYLDWLMGTFDRDPVLVLAGYNAGEGAVREAAGVPPFAETRAYVPKVLATWALTRQLCRTPPELISDGCVFRPIAVE